MAFLHSAFDWCLAHKDLLLGSLAVLINELFAWNPKLKSNSLLQFLLGLKAPASSDQAK